MENGSSANKLVSFRDRVVTVRNIASGKHVSLFLSCAGDGTLSIADADSDIPSFVEHRKLTGFPTDSLVRDTINQVLGAPHEVVSISDHGVELGKGALEGLKKMPVDIFDNVYLGEVKEKALVLCVDIRNFSNFLCCNDETEVFKLIKDFTSNLLSCVNQFGFGCSYYKLMGDGAIVIWDEATADSIASALGIFDSYIAFVNEELFKDHRELGMAGALVVDKVYKYEISAEASELKYRDYVGYGINLACRLQTIAVRDELVINRNLADTGRVPHSSGEAHGSGRDLDGLKGLKVEDRSHILLYTTAQH